MSGLNESTIQHDLQDIEGLPPSVKVYHYNGMDDFCRIIFLENDRLYGSSGPKTQDRESGASYEERKDQSITPPPIKGTTNTLDDSNNWDNDDESEHLIFIIEPTDFEHDFLDSDSLLQVNIRIFFNPKTKILVVKMASPVDREAALIFHDMIEEALEPMGLKNAIQLLGSTIMLATDGTKKQADGGWGPQRPPRDAPRRPTLVLEVSNSRSYAKLHRNVQYWVDPEKQEANVAIGISLHRNKPEITIDQWECSSGVSQPIQKAHFIIRGRSNGQVYFNSENPLPQLVIPFHLLFRRPAENNREHDIVISTRELVEFAIMVWDMQFKDEK
ncbi:uncharacterized protein PGRI_071800 [Penicillium griseofulvum]|uniref:Uncharacterized protein n=1 Tax=Penicillium patulum TaxID=5078 RepID=A0A135LYJ6_PENPA|nr:uncharacterized protein PGRI_071800 [Penicillium griseofulvum]KXG54036.1 hypothetical protein PGRI_071800 [Penicillium griseofulvum]